MNMPIIFAKNPISFKKEFLTLGIQQNDGGSFKKNYQYM